MTKRATKGIPDNLLDLARAGERVRFNGFWLGPSERDRVLAKWIDQTPQAGAVIKAILFAAITGRRAITAATTSDEYPNEIEIGEAGSALLEMDD